MVFQSSSILKHSYVRFALLIALVHLVFLVTYNFEIFEPEPLIWLVGVGASGLFANLASWKSVLVMATISVAALAFIYFAFRFFGVFGFGSTPIWRDDFMLMGFFFVYSNISLAIALSLKMLFRRTRNS